MTPAGTEDDFSALFAPEPAAGGGKVGAAPWKLLLVDDEAAIHQVIRLALRDVVVAGRPLALLDAYSAAQARTLLAENTDIALISLDVVMETNDAGLLLVQHVRQTLGNRIVRIVLLTGQPGYTPQREVVTHYEIDDYRLKSDLTADVLFTCVYAELRTWQALLNLEQKRMLEELANDLQQVNARLKVEIGERIQAQNVADGRMRDLVALNMKLEDAHVQLLQSEKMASIGLLAAGVAHEINNPIGFVNSNLNTLTQYVECLTRVVDAYSIAAGDATGKFSSVATLKDEVGLDFIKQDVGILLHESRGGLDRVKRIVQALRDFSRVDGVDSWQEHQLVSGIESTLSVVGSELKHKCEVRKEYADLPPVECVLAELNQVFMNLLLNAAHAIEDQGVVTIRTGRQGEEAWVEIADTGAGIAAENLSHIFDPFFTTKSVGKGSGLGLSVSYGIVEKHHGRIEVRSEVGKGSTFRVCLPIRQPATRAGVVQKVGAGDTAGGASGSSI
jgi:signal transduction histidine kinase